MNRFGLFLLVGPVTVVAYTYVLYPLLLRLLAIRRTSEELHAGTDANWPLISISVPMHNEEDQAAGLVESLLALDYPRDRRQILIISDASTDRTDEIVAGYRDQGIEFMRLTERGGKTAVENAAAERLRGEIIVNTDASIRIRPDALKPLIAAFQDPTVGLSSGRDVSVSSAHDDANMGESGYVGYEMWVRDLETAVGGIVGASGCLYATRADLHRISVPGHLSRDFTAALKCEEHAFRAVSVPEAVCLVPRTKSLRDEYRRKVRTISRGIRTLHFRRHLLNPFRHGLFAWKLFSHKVCRWAVPWFGLGAMLGLLVLAYQQQWALALLGIGCVLIGVGVLAWALADRMVLPGPARMLGFLVMGNVAAMHATLNAVRGRRDAIWEPTRRKDTALDVRA